MRIRKIIKTKKIDKSQTKAVKAANLDLDLTNSLVSPKAFSNEKEVFYIRKSLIFVFANLLNFNEVDQPVISAKLEI